MLTLLLIFATCQEQLQTNTGAAAVTEVLPSSETCIIHIHDWQLVPKDAFAADSTLTGKKLDEAFDEHTRTVKAI